MNSVDKQGRKRGPRSAGDKGANGQVVLEYAILGAIVILLTIITLWTVTFDNEVRTTLEKFVYDIGENIARHPIR